MDDRWGSLQPLSYQSFVVDGFEFQPQQRLKCVDGIQMTRASVGKNFVCPQELVDIKWFE